MKNKFFKILLTVIAITALLVSCADSNDVSYTENGISFTLPKSMRRTHSDVYEICFTTPATSFNVMKLDSDKLAELGLDRGMNAEEYKDFFIEENGIDRSQLELEYKADKKAYVFNYSLSPDDQNYTFYYVMIIQGSDAAWFVSMTCESDLANDYIPTFKIWERSVSVA
jgi:hypothetical protein